MKQTTIQVPAAIRKGSVRVLVGDDFSSLTDIGALRNPVITSLAENQEVEFDNVDSIKKFVKGKRMQITFDLAEINFDNLALLDAGMVTLTTVAGTEVAGASQVVASGDWSYNTFIEIDNQMGDGTAPTINSVTGGTDGALVEDTDFYVGQNEQGAWGIFIIDSTDVTTLDQTITVNYDYTPNASKKLTFSDSGDKVLKAMRIINTDNDDKEFRIDIENGTNFAPISMDFAGDEEDDVAIMPVDFQGDIVEWVDEQQTT